MSVKRIHWLWRRLSVMSPSEIVSRIGDQLYLQKLKLQYRKPPANLPHEPPGSDRKPEFNVGDFTLNTSKIAADYPSLLEGSLAYGGGEWHFDEGGDVWHTEHTTLREWPRAFFNSIDYRPGNSTGDARRTWEPARLQQLVALAVRTAELDLDEREANSALALDMIERQLVSWWVHNPLLHGVHFVSAMECGLRCVAITHAASLLESRGRLSSTVRAIVLSTLEQHADFIRKRISTHSSSGNHTLAECAGLVYASLILPERPQSAHDEEYATDLFTREFDRQVNADGGGIEQASWYHRFNVELAECMGSALEANGRPVPDLLARAIERGGHFLKALDSSSQSFVRFGDADDGYALSPYYVGRWNTASKGLAVEHFKETGLSCISLHNWKVMVQYGPLGMAPSYGHGHADALSILASYGDQEVLCDSGTGAYGGDNAKHRAHFRSCAAHNTVQVGSSDYARIMSPFMWSHPYTCQLLYEETLDDCAELWLKLEVQAEQSFSVCRYLRVDGDGLVVADKAVANGVQRITQRWHLPSGRSVTKRGGSCQIALENGSELHLELASSAETSCGLSSAQRSVRYGELEAVTAVASELNMDEEGWLFMRLTTNSRDALAESLERLSARAAEYFR